jgi:wyosine [tRNA(Phe)-imidazoG37] synthetase (radical SAM superfamily)
MSGILFERIIFGPIHSRRLGRSLGINLLPDTEKVCSMNCIYCECGWGKGEAIRRNLLSANRIIPILTQRFEQLHNDNVKIDSITYSGNGEPTIHPQFAEITDAIISLRNRYFPQTIITCLSNSTQLHRNDVREALKAIDNPLMKLDAGTQSMFELINKPFNLCLLDDICDNLREFKGKLSIQTLFLRGKLDNGATVNNTTDEEITAWLKRLTYIQPRKVILYPIDRETPVKFLEKVDKNILTQIATKVQALGMDTECY